VHNSLLQAALRRDRWLLLAALAMVLVLAWGGLLVGAGMPMGALDMTAMAGMDGWLMQPAVWTPGYALLVFAMWCVMMVAMMLPGAAPMLLLHARISRSDKMVAVSAPLTATAWFALGYLLAWTGFSAAATGLQWALEATGLLTPMLQTGQRWLAAVLLLAAGLWQLTPQKARCLRHCRSPLAYLIGSWRNGTRGALSMGLQHGGYCLGCCWFLMALLFVGGVMNLFWIAGLALYILLEKTLPMGHGIARATGVALVAWGLVMALPQGIFTTG
jgi:predicted metal-binding membrane protein